MSTGCPDEAALVAMIEGEATDEALERLHDHIDRCEACAALVVELAQLFGPEPAAAQPLDDALAEAGARYESTEVLGAGGMGIVYRAWDRALEREVALKMLRAPGGASPAHVHAAARRLLREARVLAQVIHPNVLPVYDVGERDGQVFMTMHLVEGGSLDRWLETPREWPEIVRVFIEVARGLEAAHQAGLVHRDVKPGNVLMGASGRVWISDFGLARAMRGHVCEEAPPQAEALPEGARLRLTRTGAAMGTPAYMAPEQHIGGEVDARADQFALCAALFEALHGVLPFPGEGYAALAASVCAGRLRSPQRADLPEALDAAIRRGLSAEPHQRFGSAGELADALEAALKAHRMSSALRLKAAPQVASTGALEGRAEDLRRLDEALTREGAVCLAGLGGVGKTSLARALVQARQEEAVIWISPDDARDADGLCEALADALGVPLATEAPAAQLGAALALVGDALCVWDAAEHVVDPLRELLAQWRQAAPRLRLLITSRRWPADDPIAALNLAPLALPALDAPASWQENPAVRVFLARANRQLASAEDLQAIAQLVHALDGLPLALELAAARARLMSPRAMLDRVEARLDWLRDPRRADARQSGLRAVLDEVWQDLSETAQAALAQLTTLRARFTAEDAEAILAPALRPHLFDTLDALLDAQLLLSTEDEAGVWLHMLDSVRLYAAEHLDDTARQAAAQRHAAHVARVWGAPERLDLLWREEGLPQLRALLDRRADLSQALDAAMVGDDPDVLASVLSAWLEIVSLRGPHLQSAQRGDRVLARLEQLGAAPTVRAQLMERLARLWHYDGDRGRARALVEQALALGADDDRLTASCTGQLAFLTLERRELDAALELAERAHELACRADDVRQIARWAGTRGQVLLRLGQVEAGRAMIVQARDGATRCRDWRNAGLWTLFLGIVDFVEGRLESARALFEAAQPMPAFALDMTLRIRLVEIIATLDKAQGRTASAVRGFEQVIELCETLGMPNNANVSRSNLGHLLQEQGRLVEAQRRYDEALLAIRANKGLQLAATLTLRASLARERGQLAEAEALLAEAHEIASPDHKLYLSDVFGERGLCAAEAGEWGRAVTMLSQALELSREIDNGRLVGRWGGELAAALAARGAHARAETLFDESESALREMSHASHLARVVCLRGQAAAARGDREGARRCFGEAQRLSASLQITASSGLGKALAALRASLLVA